MPSAELEAQLCLGPLDWNNMVNSLRSPHGAPFKNLSTCQPPQQASQILSINDCKHLTHEEPISSAERGAISRWRTEGDSIELASHSVKSPPQSLSTFQYVAPSYILSFDDNLGWIFCPFQKNVFCRCTQIHTHSCLFPLYLAASNATGCRYR